MTPSELKKNVAATGSNFFDRDIMKLFGDTMKNYGCCKTEINGAEVYELFRKKAVKDGLCNSAFFDCETFERVYA